MESTVVSLYSWLLSSGGSLLGFVLGTVFIAHLLRRRTSPISTLAWLLTIVLIPWVGVPLYLLLGGRKIHRMVRRKPRLALHQHPAARLDRRHAVERLFDSYALPPATLGNALHFHASGEEYYARLMALLREARESIYVSMYVFTLDAVGEAVLALLAERAHEGLRVRLLLDGYGALSTRQRRFAALQRGGGRVAWFNPVWALPFQNRANLRNHRKLVLVDERRAITGGANIACEYLGPRPWPGRWVDLSFELAGPAVQVLREIFVADWQYASGEALPAASPPSGAGREGAARVQVIPSGPDMRADPLYDALLTLCFEAETRIWIVTPYFVPDDALLRSLLLALHRGVAVRVMVPTVSNHRLPDLAGRSYLRELQAAGAEVLRYRPRMLHGKAVLIDDRVALLGSANIDMRSLLLNYETGVFVYSPAELSAVRDWIVALTADCGRGLPPAGQAIELMEGVARLLAPQL